MNSSSTIFPDTTINHCIPTNLHFQACNQLELACHIEMTASRLCLDAVRLIKTVLAGTATKNFIDVLEATFGGASEPAHFEEEEDVEEEEEEEPEKATEGAEAKPSTSSAPATRSHKHPPSTPSEVPAKKQPKKGPSQICKLKDASPIYPTVADSEAYLHSGVEDQFLSPRMSSSIYKEAGYACMYSAKMKKEGKVIPTCEFISTTKGQLSTHIRQMHLGSAIICYVCQKKSWSAVTWFEHMRKVHANLQKRNYYVQEGTNIEPLDVKAEVDPTEI